MFIVSHRVIFISFLSVDLVSILFKLGFNIIFVLGPKSIGVAKTIAEFCSVTLCSKQGFSNDGCMTPCLWEIT